MAIITEVANALFKNRKDWAKITNEDKATFAFIFNRLLSKKYPERALLLNTKDFQDKSMILEMWFHFMKTQPYPAWLWSKSPKISKTDMDGKDFDMLMKKLYINKEEDLIYMIDHYPDIINEELKRYKKNGIK